MPEHFRIVSGEDEPTRYVFGREKNHHYFCEHCGVSVFGVGNDTPVGRMYGVNIGCLDDVAEGVLSGIPITYVDGMHARWESAPEFPGHL